MVVDDLNGTATIRSEVTFDAELGMNDDDTINECAVNVTGWILTDFLTSHKIVLLFCVQEYCLHHFTSEQRVALCAFLLRELLSVSCENAKRTQQGVEHPETILCFLYRSEGPSLNLL
jgi:hypothetical protein